MKYNELGGVKMRGQNGSKWFCLTPISLCFEGLRIAMKSILTPLIHRELSPNDRLEGQMGLK